MQAMSYIDVFALLSPIHRYPDIFESRLRAVPLQSVKSKLSFPSAFARAFLARVTILRDCWQSILNPLLTASVHTYQMKLAYESVTFFIIWRRVFYWELNHS